MIFFGEIMHLEKLPYICTEFRSSEVAPTPLPISPINSIPP
jgi:hypothetical protein